MILLRLGLTPKALTAKNEEAMMKSDVSFMVLERVIEYLQKKAATWKDG